jgi:hypothetical protein
MRFFDTVFGYLDFWSFAWWRVDWSGRHLLLHVIYQFWLSLWLARQVVFLVLRSEEGSVCYVSIYLVFEAFLVGILPGKDAS